MCLPHPSRSGCTVIGVPLTDWAEGKSLNQAIHAWSGLEYRNQPHPPEQYPATLIQLLRQHALSQPQRRKARRMILTSKVKKNDELDL